MIFSSLLPHLIRGLTSIRDVQIHFILLYEVLLEKKTVFDRESLRERMDLAKCFMSQNLTCIFTIGEAAWSTCGVSGKDEGGRLGHFKKIILHNYDF